MVNHIDSLLIWLSETVRINPVDVSSVARASSKRYWVNAKLDIDTATLKFRSDYAPKKSFDIKSPATEKVLHKSAGASVDDTAKAVDAAAEALKSWRRTTPEERQDILLKAADIMSRRRDENAPYMLGTRAVAFPIAAGNTVVLKASESCPRTFWALVDVLRDAGLPKGVVNLLVHEPSDAAAVTSSLITDPRVKKINFTGSAAVGRIIVKQAAEHLKPVVLELGGKAPTIVWEDAD
ncbi:hypothetical protein E4U59_001272 [Claviceps monticola]|nr:hypothetical protein E4U59_001272 [Claviceps monticola]